MLRRCDIFRADVQRSPKAEEEWRVSRALIQHALPGDRRDQAVCGLSHSAGHALLAVAPPGWRVAVDLERMRPRDFPGLAEWCCDEAELVFLRTLSSDLLREWFYRFWTLKEAYVKAAGLDFPADMKSVGLAQDGQRWVLRGPEDGLAWQACTMAVGDQWIASVVWCGPDAGFEWHTPAGDTLPDVRVLWRSAGGLLPSRPRPRPPLSGRAL
ncbi:4'-phosphopantetheinyl transferase family protein [Bordetella genomosp. 13]|uniref:4'-phosphopantetheinyl transferase family protein n=1 Tax=Bordetella genomosp. 13 TaxID=463040 RepID=UPI001642F17C|nr:4'-phosphopantetheinyl transferase superfamily protein [Bordetella genomosp. 13]